MSYAKRQKKHDRDSIPFVRLPSEMLLFCSEWKALSPSAKLLYLHIKAKYNGANNGDIKLSYSMLKGVMGISSPKTISKAQQELLEKGWIKRTEYGGLYRCSILYKLTWEYDVLK